MTECPNCAPWRRYAAHKERELAYLHDRLAELDPAYAATRAAWEATRADPAKMAWLREQEARLEERRTQASGHPHDTAEAE